MGKFIKVIKTGIDVSKVTEQLRKNPADWNHQKKEEGVRSLVDEHGFDDLPVSNLQLTIGAVQKKEDFVGDSELNVNTPAYKRHTEILKLIKEDFGNKEIYRCGFLALPVDEYVGAHIDEGTYYKTKDRYHLSIVGEYQYFTGCDTIVVNQELFFGLIISNLMVQLILLMRLELHLYLMLLILPLTHSMELIDGER